MGVSVTWIGERVTVEDIFGIVKHGKGVHVEVGEEKVIKCWETFHVRWVNEWNKWKKMQKETKLKKKNKWDLIYSIGLKFKIIIFWIIIN